MIEGWEPRQRSIHLTFGILLHSALEKYDYAKAEGKGHEEAQREIILWLMKETWDEALGRSNLGDDPYKNRYTLVRTVSWYLEQFGQEDSLRTVILSNGLPAVELSFAFDSSYKSRTGEHFILCGHLDRVAQLGKETYIVDRKTTKATLGVGFFEKFSPDNQFTLYCIAGRVAFNQPIKGFIIDAAQVAVGFSRFERQMIRRTDAQLDDWTEGLGWWLRAAENCAGQAAENCAAAIITSWPQNDKSCSQYGGCAFMKVCARSGGARQMLLETDFTRRVWDPMKKRGAVQAD